MILGDANLLIYAYDVTSRHRKAAAAWLEASFAGTEPFGFSWSSIQAFLRVLTNRRYPGAVSFDIARSLVDGWFEMPNFVILHPGPNHWGILARMISQGDGSGPLITDAHIASLAIEHGATLCTNDRDFARFPGLKLSNPLR